MSESSNMRKVLLFGLFGSLGCLSGWFVGEVFLRVALPATKEAGGSLASKPVLPALSSNQVPPAPPPALPVGLSLTGALPPPASPPPALRVGSSKTPSPPAPPPPTLPLVSSATPAPPPPEFAQRLEKAGAKSGDVQITLIWFNVNDLDLHCIDPGGEEIFFNHRRSRSGGELDVDMNANGAETNRPIENIYWPPGKAPSGKYTAFVNHFANHGGRDPTDYKVNVLVDGRRQQFAGKISGNQPKRLICEFEVKPPAPELRLAVSPEVVVNQGGKNQLKVRIVRRNVSGPLALRLEGDLRGISPQVFSIPANETEATAEIAADPSAPPGDRVLSVKASAALTKADSSFRLTVKETGPELRLAVSPELIVYQGGKNQLKVSISRTNFNGPVNIHLDGNLQGISPPAFLIAANETEATVEIAADKSAQLGVRTLAVLASAGMAKADASIRLTVKETPPELRLAVSPELVVNQGGSNRLRIRISQSQLSAPVRVRVDGDLRGISAREVTFNTTETETTAEIHAEPSAPADERTLTVIASSGALHADASFRLQIKAAPPLLRLALPSEIQVSQRGQNQLPVRIARDRFTGPVSFRLKGDLTGVTLEEFTISADRNEDEVTLTVADAAVGIRDVQVTASGSGVQAEGILKLIVTSPPGPRWSWSLVVVIGLWTAILAVGLSMSLVICQNWYLARPWLSLGEFAVLTAGGLVAGVVAGGVGQTLYGPGLPRSVLFVPK